MRLAALAAVVFLLVVEAALRTVGYSAPQWHQLDPQLG